MYNNTNIFVTVSFFRYKPYFQMGDKKYLSIMFQKMEVNEFSC